MKNKINSVEDAFVYHLQQLIYTESRIKNGIFSEGIAAASPRIKQELRDYADSSYSKLLKLERIFNYLMREPDEIKSALLMQMMGETVNVIHQTSSHTLKDILIVNAFRTINAIKASNYKNAYLFSVELELDTPADLLQQILEWEIASGKTLSRLTIAEFNNIALPGGISSLPQM
jgi:ferritin-like metal-binding protein YciE